MRTVLLTGLVFNRGVWPAHNAAEPLFDYLPALAERTVVTDMMLVLGIVLITAWAFSKLRKRRRSDAQRPTALEQLELSRQQRGMRGDLEDLMVEIEQLARRLGAQLDAKSFHIEKLMREADQRIARLEQLNPGQHSPRETTHPAHAVSEPRTNPSPAPSEPADPNASAPSLNDALARSVYDLADRGLNAVDIARQLDEHVGKVELILALRES